MSVLGSAYTMEIGNSNEVYFLSGAKLYLLSGPTLTQQAVPWNVNNTEITRLAMAFGADGQMTVNVSGTEFCQECGVYRFDGTQWSNFHTPNIVSDHSPITGLALLQDGTPMVQTNFSPALSPAGTMGYYYYREEELSVAGPTVTAAYIYPNPANGFVNVHASHDVKITVFNAIGQEVCAFAVPGSTTYRLDMATLSKGLYILRIEDGTLTESKKLIVE